MQPAVLPVQVSLRIAASGGCALVGIEITPDALNLPGFRHPRRAAYILGPERGNLPEDMLSRCDHVVKILTGFAINVGLAGALVMYDRLLSPGRFASRPLRPGGGLPLPEFGRPARVRKARRRSGAADG